MAAGTAAALCLALGLSLAPASATSSLSGPMATAPAGVQPHAPGRTTPPQRARLAAGVALVASHRITGRSFARSVVLLLDYDAHGATGIVINRPMRRTLASVLPRSGSIAAGQLPLNLGGPVEPSRLLFLIRSAEPVQGSTPVLPGVHVTQRLESLAPVLKASGDHSRVRAYAGRAGWAPGQLDTEVARGDWYVIPTDVDEVFSSEPASLWRALIDWITGLRARVGPAPRGTESAS